MRQITSLLREAATRRRLIDAGNDAGGAPADHSTVTLSTLSARAAQSAACWAETLSARLTYAFQAQQPSSPAPQMTPVARASSDFTKQVMARLASPPPEPDPRETRAKQTHTHMRRLAGVYMALVLASIVALLLLAMLAPWLLLGLIAAGVSLALIAMTFAVFVSRLTGGVVSGIGVAYLAMLAALAPPLLLLARRTGRRPFSSTRRL